MVVTREITLNTRGECDIIDITPNIEQEVAICRRLDGRPNHHRVRVRGTGRPPEYVGANCPQEHHLRPRPPLG